MVASSVMARWCVGSQASPCHRLTRTCYTPTIPPRTYRRSAVMLPAGCNTVITLNGRRCGRSAKRIGSRGWPMCYRDPPQRGTTSFRARANARVCPRGRDRAGRLQRYPSGQRKLHAAAWHARRDHAVEISCSRRWRTDPADFPGQRRKKVVKEVIGPRICKTIERLLELRGRRLFQYRTEDGGLRPVNAQEVNEFLRRLPA